MRRRHSGIQTGVTDSSRRDFHTTIRCHYVILSSTHAFLYKYDAAATTRSIHRWPTRCADYIASEVFLCAASEVTTLWLHSQCVYYIRTTDASRRPHIMQPRFLFIDIVHVMSQTRRADPYQKYIIGWIIGSSYLSDWTFGTCFPDF